MRKTTRRGASRIPVLCGSLVFAQAAPGIAEDELAAPQVHLEVRFLEVQNDSLGELGVDWKAQPAGPAVLEALRNPDVARLLAEPSADAAPGKSAVIVAGSETALAPATPPFRVRLEITPRVTPEGFIQLDVRPSVTHLDVGGAAPVVTQSEQQVVLPDVKPGGTAVIGGLLQADASRLPEKVPGLDRLPILGPLFRSPDFRQGKTDLIILIQPSILDEYGSARSAAGSGSALVHSVAASGGVIVQSLPSASGGLGVVDVGGAEEFFLKYPLNVNGWSAGASSLHWNLGPTIGGIDTHVSLGGYYGKGDADERREVAGDPGRANGISYWDTAANDSPGIASLGAGLEGKLDYEFQTFQLEARLLADISEPIDDLCDWFDDEDEYGYGDPYDDAYDEPAFIEVGGKRIYYDQIERSIRLARPATFVEVSGRAGYARQHASQAVDLVHSDPGFATFDVGSQNRLDLEEWSGLVGFGLVHARPIPWVEGLAVHLGTGFGLGYRDSSGDGEQRNRCDVRFTSAPGVNVCAPEVRDFTLQADLEKSGFDWDLGASARLSYQLPFVVPGLFVSLGYDFDYVGISRVAAGRNLSVDGPLHLERTHQARHLVGLNLGWNFSGF